jgi:hypothetical protein
LEVLDEEIMKSRFGHTATGLPDGRILAIGGDEGSIEIPDPQTNRFGPRAPPLFSAKEGR